MKSREEKQQKTDKAWNELYARLEQDGLLPQADAPVKQHFMQSVPLRWAACIALLLAGTVAAWFIKTNFYAGEDKLLLANEKGKPTLVTTFEDGSIAYLSEQASVEYPRHFAEDSREIYLKGDAFFEVSSNKQRPFVIETQQVRIEVVGTTFNVRSKDNESFSLSVRTGKVKVTSKKSGESVFVTAGQTALLRDDQLRALQTRDFDQFNRYLKFIHFKDQRLSNVVRIINENTDSIQLKISPELGDRLLTVTFHNDSPQTMAQLICLALNLELTVQQNIININQPK